MLSSFTTLKLDESSQEVLCLTLNRPDVLNAINSVMMEELFRFWGEVSALSYRCIVITGQGDSAFCAGADLKERYQLSETLWREQHAVLQQAILAMNACTIPIVAAVNGVAFGGGLELALSADFIYAANTARFAMPEVKLGLMPGAMGTVHLPRACGLRRAKELALTGKPFSAEEAFAWGIVNQLCSSQEVLDAALGVAHDIALNAPLSIEQVKSSMNSVVLAELEADYCHEVSCYNKVLGSSDRVEGVSAFNEKRTPIFKGE